MFTVRCIVNSSIFRHDFPTLSLAECYRDTAVRNFPGGVFEIV